MQLTALFAKNNSPKDVMLGVTVFTVVSCVIKFLLDDVSLTLAHHVVNFGHTDPLAYGAILAPVLGTHGYVKTRNFVRNPRSPGIDNPDA